MIGDEQLLSAIKTTHEANYCAYGYRKMWLALKRAGHDVYARMLELIVLAGVDELQVIAGLPAGPQRSAPDVPAAPPRRAPRRRR